MRCLHKSCSVFRALLNNIWFGGLTQNLKNRNFQVRLRIGFSIECCLYYFEIIIELAWVGHVLCLMKILGCNTQHYVNFDFIPETHVFWHCCTAFSHNLWQKNWIRKMFAPINSTHRTEQSDIGFGVSEWLLKFDPRTPIFGTELENFEKNPKIVFSRSNIGRQHSNTPLKMILKPLVQPLPWDRRKLQRLCYVSFRREEAIAFEIL